MSWNSKSSYSYITCWRLGPCDTALYEMTFTHFVKRHSALFGIERFVAVFTRAHHCIICWDRWIQSTHAAFLYHPKACFPVTRWSLMLRILKGFWRKVLCVCVCVWVRACVRVCVCVCVCISNKPHANWVLQPCHTLFDELDNILWSSMRGKLCLSPSERNTGKEGMRDRRWPEGQKVTGEWKKITLWAASWFVPFEIHILTNLQV
jgi:hypothetical protein